MNRFDSEFERLYGPADPAGGVRALGVELARPADWARMAALAQAVQTELGWPAPAVAVNGRDGYQLWWSLAEAVTPAEAAQWVAALQRRHLADVPAHRVHGHAGPTAPAVPALRADSGCWSAFVAADLAPVFEDSPGLDLEPGLAGQADLLAALRSVSPAEWAEAGRRWGATEPMRSDRERAPCTPAPVPASASVSTSAPGAEADPRRFLLGVMNDERVDLRLRIEAASALLRAGGG